MLVVQCTHRRCSTGRLLLWVLGGCGSGCAYECPVCFAWACAAVGTHGALQAVAAVLSLREAHLGRKQHVCRLRVACVFRVAMLVGCDVSAGLGCFSGCMGTWGDPGIATRMQLLQTDCRPRLLEAFGSLGVAWQVVALLKDCRGLAGAPGARWHRPACRPFQEWHQPLDCSKGPLGLSRGCLCMHRVLEKGLSCSCVWRCCCFLSTVSLLYSMYSSAGHPKRLLKSWYFIRLL